MIEYRQARESDAQAIGRLHARNFRDNNPGVFTVAFRDTDLPAEMTRSWQERLARPSGNQFVQIALDATNLLGFVAAYGDHDAQWGSLIDNLHVDHAARRVGVGSSLMKQVGAWLAFEYSGMALYLLVLESNSAARQLYEEIGGCHDETLAMETHGGAVVRNCRYTWPDPQEMVGSRQGARDGR